jgi:SAM-dependent methyltransferase
VPHPLPLTGERTLPGATGEEYWFARHEAAYGWIVETFGERLRGAVVVDAGSGEGYGAATLGDAGAREVLALEFDEASVAHAARAYPEVTTLRANLAAMPLAAGSVDVLVSLQVVEHLWDLRGFLRDCFSALRPGGLLVVSTPNRPVFSPGLARGAKPTNPFHVEELDAEQLEELLHAAGFGDVTLHGLHHGARIEAWEKESGESLVAAQVRRALNPAAEQRGLREFVGSVAACDFRVGDADLAQDLIAVGRA